MDINKLSTREKQELIKRLQSEVNEEAIYIKRSVVVSAIVNIVTRPSDQYGAISDRQLIDIYEKAHLAKYPESSINTEKYELADDGADKMPTVLNRNPMPHYLQN